MFAGTLRKTWLRSTPRVIDGLKLGLKLGPDRCEVLAGLGRGPSFYVVPYGIDRSAPRMIAALAGFVHDRQSAADYEHNHDKNA